jgi:hypothetical protein
MSTEFMRMSAEFCRTTSSSTRIRWDRRTSTAPNLGVEMSPRARHSLENTSNLRLQLLEQNALRARRICGAARLEGRCSKQEVAALRGRNTSLKRSLRVAASEKCTHSRQRPALASEKCQPDGELGTSPTDKRISERQPRVAA